MFLSGPPTVRPRPPPSQIRFQAQKLTWFCQSRFGLPIHLIAFGVRV